MVSGEARLIFNEVSPFVSTQSSCLLNEQKLALEILSSSQALGKRKYHYFDIM
jgi:hypothetical protein